MSATTIYSFTGIGTDGYNPFAGVTLDAAGDIFGTTFYGGADGYGVVYEIKAGATTATTLYSFTGGTDGSNPSAGVTLDAAGNIFGTTFYGGADGVGTVYEIAAGATTATPLYSFTGTGTDGANPYAGVTFDAAGDILGTTLAGGADGYGTVYEIAAGATTATTLYSFTGTGTDGADPYAGVTLDAAGNIFGTTISGGKYVSGVVYEIAAGATTATTLYSFSGNDGSAPFGGVTLDAAGDIFGTTLAGGADGYGTVYEIKAGATTATTLYSFTGTGTDGADPYAGVTLDAAGNIFGTTYSGGEYGNGVVYEIAAGATTATTLYSFTGTGTDGANPYAGVTLDAAGHIFGTTYLGGADGVGTVFEIDPACYYPGTSILTEAGPRAVESLAIGDRVVTHDGGVWPVRWIGKNTVSKRFSDPLRVLPIRIKAGALGECLPERDLLVSPEHALLVEDILVHAGALVNGLSITRENDVPESFIYYHVELAEHSLILAEGAPAESFVDNIDRMAFDNWDEYRALYGDEPIKEMACPRAKSYRQVPKQIRARIMERARAVCGAISVAA